MKSIIVSAQAGCLLPFLIIFNLFFGWMFFKPAHWLLIEAILILISIATSIVFVKKIFSAGSNGSSRRNNAIDIEGKIVNEDKNQLGGRKSIDG